MLGLVIVVILVVITCVAIGIGWHIHIQPTPVVLAVSSANLKTTPGSSPVYENDPAILAFVNSYTTEITIAVPTTPVDTLTALKNNPMWIFPLGLMGFVNITDSGSLIVVQDNRGSVGTWTKSGTQVIITIDDKPETLQAMNSDHGVVLTAEGIVLYPAIKSK